MTLPKITADEDEVDGDTIERTTEGKGNEAKRLGSTRRTPGTGVRARALKQNDAYLVENLVWNNKLERCFVSLGLLREYVFGPVSIHSFYAKELYEFCSHALF